jgi:hypothetical protein
MADAARRRRAGGRGAGDQANDLPEETSKPARRPGGKKKITRTQQAKIFDPSLIEFEVAREDGTTLRFGVPTEFTIGDIVNRKALDDLDAFARLALIETSKLAGEDAPTGLAIFASPAHVMYAEVALSLGSVRDFCRRLTVKVARVIEDDVVTDQRVAIEDVSMLSGGDLLMLELWYIRRYCEVFAKAKNALRTAPTTPKKTTGE